MVLFRKSQQDYRTNIVLPEENNNHPCKDNDETETERERERGEAGAERGCENTKAK